MGMMISAFIFGNLYGKCTYILIPAVMPNLFRHPTCQVYTMAVSLFEQLPLSYPLQLINRFHIQLFYRDSKGDRTYLFDVRF